MMPPWPYELWWHETWENVILQHWCGCCNTIREGADGAHGHNVGGAQGQIAQDGDNVEGSREGYGSYGGLEVTGWDGGDGGHSGHVSSYCSRAYRYT